MKKEGTFGGASNALEYHDAVSYTQRVRVVLALVTRFSGPKETEGQGDTGDGD